MGQRSTRILTLIVLIMLMIPLRTTSELNLVSGIQGVDVRARHLSSAPQRKVVSEDSTWLVG